MKYRKKPIIIEAYQTDVELDIETLEGVMHASIGDYIITGINGEKYPCKPDIFEKTYELVEENNYKSNKELSLLKAFNKFLEYVDTPTKMHLMTFGDEKGLKEYRVLRTQIETALKNYEELTSKPVILYGRTNGHTKALIDMISKNYKEIKITNLEDEKKSKALKIIKDKKVDIPYIIENPEEKDVIWYNSRFMGVLGEGWRMLTQEEYDLIKEVLLWIDN